MRRGWCLVCWVAQLADDVSLYMGPPLISRFYGRKDRVWKDDVGCWLLVVGGWWLLSSAVIGVEFHDFNQVSGGFCGEGPKSSV